MMVQRPCTSLYLTIQGYGTFGWYRLVSRRGQGGMTVNQNGRNMLVCTSTYLYILVHTDSYQSCKSRPIYTLVLVCTSTYQYRKDQKSTYQYVLACTGIYQYIPGIPGFKKSANRVRTRDLVHTSRILYHCAASTQQTNSGYLSREMLVYILIQFCSCPCTWLLMTN